MGEESYAEFKCPQCGITTLRQKSRRLKYCSKKCADRSQEKTPIPAPIVGAKATLKRVRFLDETPPPECYDGDDWRTKVDAFRKEQQKQKQRAPA